MRFIVILFATLISCATSWLRAESTLIVGEEKVKAGGQVTIPIDLEHDGSVVGLQFDLFLPIDEIQHVDVGECFVKEILSTSINACGQMKAPNHDVIRYLLVNSTLSPLPSGHLTDLVIDIKQKAFSGRYSLTIAPSTALAISKDAGMLPLAFQSGQIRIAGGQHPSARPEEVEPILFADSNFTENFTRDPSTAISHKVVNDFELLAGNPEYLSVLLPDNIVISANRKDFRADKGFVPRIGTGEPLTDPYIPESERSYFWRGFENRTDVRFTVHNGYVRGSIISPDGSFTVAGSFGDVAVNLIDLDNLPPSDAEAYLTTNITYTTQPQSHVEPVSARSVADVQIDVLVMFTEQARLDAGGQVGLDALILESMNNLNAAVQDGEVEGVSFNLVSTQQLFGFIPTSANNVNYTYDDARNDLRTIRLDPSVRSARDSTNADIVLVLLRDYWDAQGSAQLGACGIAFLQNKVCNPNTVPIDNSCTVGPTYEDYAYGWVSVWCANHPARNAFPHEIGHIMGAEHQVLTGSPPSEASYPWSYGYEDRSNDIATLMWAPGVNQPETTQYVQFSNPQVLINGFNSGVDEESENAYDYF